MSTFTYRAKNRVGEDVVATLEAPSKEIAQEMIRLKDLILLEIAEHTPYHWRQQLLSLTNHVSAKDIVIFSRQLAVLISANVSIVRALRILAKQTANRYLSSVIATIADEVDGGARLSVAMRQWRRLFDDFFVYMIRAGETTGQLDEVLTYLADQKEKDYELRSRILLGLIYPAFVVTVLVVVFVVMMIFVVPKLLAVVAQTGVDLPLATRMLIIVSNFFTHYWWVLVALVVGVIAALTYARAVPAGRAVLDRIKLHIPVIGRILFKIYLTRLARSLANLLGAGVPVNKSLAIVADVVGNAAYKNLLLSAQKEIEAGVALSESLTHSPLIPPMMAQMMVIGEETGKLDQILEKVALFYSREVDGLTRAMASLIEPLIIILIGCGAVLVVLGILLPVYSSTAAL